ncbi:MAG: VOC family protein [Thermoplasmata archaeon]|nr:VOC family protein [Thermoplasmata archaeon]
MRAQDFGVSCFDHVDIKVRDRAKARHFFVDQLGLDVLGEGPDHTFLVLGDQVLGLRDAGKGERTQGVHHLAFRVQEWTGLRNRLKRARIEVSKEKERDDSRSLYLKGPGGLLVELVYRPDPSVRPCRMTHAPPAAPPDETESPAPKRRRR